jgi:hypothetical protein
MAVLEYFGWGLGKAYRVSLFKERHDYAKELCLRFSEVMVVLND